MIQSNSAADHYRNMPSSRLDDTESVCV